MNNSDKFYFMGLIFADGYLIEKKKYQKEYIGISLIDEQILKDVSNAFGFAKPKEYGKTSANNPMYHLKIKDANLINEYREYGLVPRKTLILKLYKDLPNDYIWDFVRGYFDGDGCIHYRKIKDRANSYRGEFSLLGTESILYYIKDFFEKENIKCGVKKYDVGKISILKVSKFESLKMIYQKMYKDENSLWLKRKNIHFKEFIDTKELSFIEQAKYVKKEQEPRMDKNTFIKKMNELYKDEGYDFSLSEYTKSYNKTAFICPVHGVVEQNIEYLLRGRGCPKCSKKYVDNEKFISKANELHNNKYDYSKVEYKNNKTKICIICPEHGEFLQTPSNHLLGRGCPKCGKIKNYSARAKENNKKRKENKNG